MIRTGFSFRIAYGHLKEVADRVKEIGWAKQPIADHCSTFGFNRWSKLVPNPVYGVELSVGVMSEKRMVYDAWTFLAKKELEPLHDVIGLATKAQASEPYIDYNQAQSCKGLV